MDAKLTKKFGNAALLAPAAAMVVNNAGTPAEAADLAPIVVAPVAVAPVNPFHGFSIGLGLGGQLFDTTASYIHGQYNQDENIFTETNTRTDLSGSGVFGTVEIGYDHSFGLWTAGIYGDYQFGNQTGDFSSQVCVDGCDYEQNVNGQLKLKDGFSLVGRVGRQVGANGLAYGLIGWTWRNYELGISNDAYDGESDNSYLAAAARSGTTNGLTLGGGFEYLITRSFSIKGEYRYQNLSGKTVATGDFDTDYDSGGAWVGNSDTSSYSNPISTGGIHNHQVRVVGSWKFNMPR